MTNLLKKYSNNQESELHLLAEQTNPLKKILLYYQLKQHSKF